MTKQSIKEYYIYILTNQSNSVLNIGITNNLVKRVFQHKNKLINGFTKKYNVNKLVYFEQFKTPLEAITREKQLKGGSRQKKLELINRSNPDFKDLYTSIL